MSSSRRSIIRYSNARCIAARALRTHERGGDVYVAIWELQGVIHHLENLHCSVGMRMEVSAFTSKLIDELSVLHNRRRLYEKNMPSLV